jgi:hypothetical protein
MRTMSVRCVTIVQRTCRCIVLWGASLPFQQEPMAGSFKCVWPAARATHLYWHAQNFLKQQASKQPTAFCVASYLQQVVQEGVCVCVFTRRQPPLFCRPLWRRARGNHHTSSSSSRRRGAKPAARAFAGEKRSRARVTMPLAATAPAMLHQWHSSRCTNLMLD